MFPVAIANSTSGEILMHSFFLGIDPSATSTGLTLLSDDSSYCKTLRIQPRKLRDAQRLHYISQEIKTFIGDLSIELCVHEAPSYGSTHKEFILGEVLGAIKLTLAQLDIPILGVPPTQLKKYFTSRGNATKQDMIDKAKSLGCPSSQEDICDSYAASMLCKDLIQGPLLNTRASIEVRASILENSNIKGSIK